MTTEETRNHRKVRIGIVVSDKMDKTVKIRIDHTEQHPLYRRTIHSTSKLTAHDEKNECKLGDRVRVMETRPLSKTKCWRVVEILERAS